VQSDLPMVRPGDASVAAPFTSRSPSVHIYIRSSICIHALHMHTYTHTPRHHPAIYVYLVWPTMGLGRRPVHLALALGTYIYIYLPTYAFIHYVCIHTRTHLGIYVYLAMVRPSDASVAQSPRARPRYIYIRTSICMHALHMHTYKHTPRHLCIFSDGATKRRLGRPVTSRSPSVHIYAYIYMHNTMHYICIHKRTTQAYMSIPSDLR